jgi:flagellar basal body-associated protein FliL
MMMVMMVMVMVVMMMMMMVVMMMMMMKKGKVLGCSVIHKAFSVQQPRWVTRSRMCSRV